MTRLGHQRRGDLLRLAVWSLDGSAPLQAAVLIQAARDSRRVFEHALTQRLAKAAFDVGAGTDAHLLLADALYWQGEHDKAIQIIENLPVEPADRPAPSIAWQAIVTASILHWGLSDTRSAERVLLQAEARLGPGSERDELAAHRAALVVYGGRPIDGITIAQPILSAPTATDMTKARAVFALPPALTATGRTDQAIHLAKEGLRVATQVSDQEPWVGGHCRAGHAFALWVSGRYAEMRSIAEAAYAETLTYDVHDLHSLWSLLVGLAMLGQGEICSAADQLKEAAHLLHPHDHGGFRSWALASLAQSCAQLNRHDEAIHALDQARKTHPSAIKTHDTMLTIAGAWIEATQGWTSAATRQAEQAARQARQRKQHGLEAYALYEATRLGSRSTADRLNQLTSTVDGPAIGLYASHANAWASADAAALLRTAQSLAQLGAILCAAEAAAQAAAIHRRTGGTSEAINALASSRRWANACQGANSPILRHAASSPEIGALSIREREIADLAARNYTSRRIATALGLSPRTVENHLGHIYTKLGISNRTSLSAILRQHHNP